MMDTQGRMVMMKRVKRWLSALLVLVMVVGLMPVRAEAYTIASGKCGKNVRWSLDSSGTMTISGSGDMYDYTPVSNSKSTGYAPWGDANYERNGKWDKIQKIVIQKGVTSVGDHAFYQCQNLRSVSIPNSVTKIGDGAFGTGGDSSACTKLTSISIPNSVKSIGSGAFGNTGLTKVTIPNSVKTIGSSAFMRSGVESVQLPEGLETIQESTFQWSNLREIKIPKSVKRIEGWAFFGDFSLKTVTMLGNVNYIGEGAFADCKSLNKIYFKGNAPRFQSDAFCDVNATAYYPANNSTWTASVKKNYGGQIKWVAWNPDSGSNLATPKITKVQNVNGGVKLTWNKVSGAVKYRVFYKTKNGSWTKIGDTTGTALTWKGAKCGTGYHFTVRCVSKDGKKYTSDYNTKGVYLPYAAVPTLSKAVNEKSRAVALKWKKPGLVNGYQIQYSTDKTFKTGCKKLMVKNGNTLTKTITNLTRNKTYYFRVQSYKTMNGKNYYSAWSKVKSLKISK